MGRGVVVGGFVQEVGGVRHDDKAVGKALRNPHLLVVVFGQFYTDPLAKGGGAFADVHGHIKYGAVHHAHQFALGLLQLVVQATQHALGAAAVVVLHKVHIQAGDVVEVLLVEAFKKEASAVAEHFGLEDQDVGDVGGGDGVGHGGLQLALTFQCGRNCESGMCLLRSIRSWRIRRMSSTCSFETLNTTK